VQQPALYCHPPPLFPPPFLFFCLRGCRSALNRQYGRGKPGKCGHLFSSLPPFAASRRSLTYVGDCIERRADPLSQFFSSPFYPAGVDFGNTAGLENRSSIEGALLSPLSFFPLFSGWGYVEGAKRSNPVSCWGDRELFRTLLSLPPLFLSHPTQSEKGPSNAAERRSSPSSFSFHPPSAKRRLFERRALLSFFCFSFFLAGSGKVLFEGKMPINMLVRLRIFPFSFGFSPRPSLFRNKRSKRQRAKRQGKARRADLLFFFSSLSTEEFERTVLKK